MCPALLQALGGEQSDDMPVLLEATFHEEEASVSMEKETTQPGRKEQGPGSRPGTFSTPALALTSSPWPGPGDLPILPGHGAPVAGTGGHRGGLQEVRGPGAHCPAGRAGT